MSQELDLLPDPEELGGQLPIYERHLKASGGAWAKLYADEDKASSMALDILVNDDDAVKARIDEANEAVRQARDELTLLHTARLVKHRITLSVANVGRKRKRQELEERAAASLAEAEAAEEEAKRRRMEV